MTGILLLLVVCTALGDPIVLQQDPVLRQEMNTSLDERISIAAQQLDAIMRALEILDAPLSTAPATQPTSPIQTADASVNASP